MARTTQRRTTGNGRGDIDLRESGGADRGRDADSPTEVPPKGWFDVLKRTWKQRKEDNAQIISAGVAYYLFLSIVPTLTAVISIYGLIASPADVQRQLSGMLSALPSAAADFVQSQVENIASANPSGLGIGLAVSVLAALWSASKGMAALITALNIAYDEEETRGFLKTKGLALLMTLGLVLTAIVGIGGMVFVASLASNLGSAASIAVLVARWVGFALIGALALAALYRFAPDRDAPEWKWVSPGAAVALVVILAASIGFSFYVRSFGSFNETYGAFAGIIILLLWLYIVSFIIVMGAEMDAELEKQTRKDTTTGGEEPMGTREAQAADTVATGSS